MQRDRRVKYLLRWKGGTFYNILYLGEEEIGLAWLFGCPIAKQQVANPVHLRTGQTLLSKRAVLLRPEAWVARALKVRDDIGDVLPRDTAAWRHRGEVVHDRPVAQTLPVVQADHIPRPYPWFALVPLSRHRDSTWANCATNVSDASPEPPLLYAA